MTDNRIFIDPKTFTEKDLPVIVCCDDLRGFIGWAIKAHTGGDYNHAFIINKPGRCVSQDFGGFREKSIDLYMIPGQMLKFFRLKDMTDNERILIKEAITKRLSLPWWRRSYDFIGTFVGQLINVKWIQNPFQEFCSEQVNDDYLKAIPRASVINLKEPSPSELNASLVSHPELIECIGYWWSD